MFDWLFKKEETEVAKIDETLRKQFVVLIVMDGFGIHPDKLGNAVLQAQTPFLDRAWTFGKSTLLHASGTHVGLPAEEPGNSEVGHLNIGSGQVVYQSLPRINDAIASGQFKDHPVIKEMIAQVKKRNSKLHFMGILSAGGVHGHIEHLFELIDIAKANGVSPNVHAILDGRDTGMTDGYFYLSKLIEKFKNTGVGQLASVMGRFYGMDRDKRWERTQLAYNAMVGLGQRTAIDPFALVQEAYKNGENDQILLPTTMVDQKGNALAPIAENDVVLFYNYREDRARQITRAFVVENFDNFPRPNFPKNLYFATMTGYEDSIPTHIIFPPKRIVDTLASTISKGNMNQLHISETEKFMHTTYFFNGGVEQPHAGEDFFNVPSPKVFDYTNTPQMSAEIIRDEVIYRISNMSTKKYSFIVINFANPDMLGHTGNLQAAISANEITDRCVRDITVKALEAGGAVFITSDHGNCETMIDRVTKKIDTAHNNNPVPFIILSDPSQVSMETKGKLAKIGTGDKAQPTGILADIAPTVLGVLGVPLPASMTGINLLTVL